MSLRTKLLLTLIPLAVAIGVVGALAVATVSALGRQSERILLENYRSVLAAQRMKEAIERIEDAAVLAVVDADRTRALAPAAQHRVRFESELQAAEGNITEPGELEATQQLRAAWATYQAQFNRFTAADPASARTMFSTQLEPSFATLRSGIDEILAMNQDAMVRKSDEAQRYARQVNTLMIVAAIAALLIGGLISITLTTRLLEPFGLLTRTVHRIGEGDFEARTHLDGRDELAQLARDINTMAARLNQYRRSSLGDLLLAQQVAQAVIDSLPDPVVVFDIAGVLLSINQAAETVLRIAFGTGDDNPLEAAPAAVQQLLDRMRQHVLSGKGPYSPKSFEEAVQVSLPDGDRWLLPRATPLYGEGRTITGVTVVLQDITRLRRIDELRNDLVATVAHEFRTPLTSLRMAIHLCVERTAGPLTEKQADLLYAAREDCERLQSMVDELLDLARIQAGQIELRQETTAPAALLDAAVDAHRSLAQVKNVQCAVTVMPGAEAVTVDRERIQLVLSNLLANAIRHSSEGGTVTLRALSTNGAVRFEVIDAGEGIPPEYQRSIFDKFVQIPGRVPGGAGLGLSYAKEIVEAHGGQIGVISSAGSGSTFWFTVPAAHDA